MHSCIHPSIQKNHPARPIGSQWVSCQVSLPSGVSVLVGDGLDDARELVREKVLAESRAFDTHLRAAVMKHGAAERKKALLALEALPEFRRSHPTVEHFTPLIVAAGAAGDAAEIEPLGVDVVEPGMSYLNVRFT